MKYLLETDGFTNEVRKGFLFYVASSDQIHKIISPNFSDQSRAMKSKFEGMTEEPFSYPDFERTRENLVALVGKRLTDDDKQFLLSVQNGKPDWEVYDFEHFPAIQWKLENLRKLREKNPNEYKKQYDILESALLDG